MCTFTKRIRVQILKQIISLILVAVLVGGLTYTFKSSSPDDKLGMEYMPDIFFNVNNGENNVQRASNTGAFVRMVDPGQKSNITKDFSKENYDPFILNDDTYYESEGEYSPISLMYHSINETPFTSLTGLFVRPSEFEDHLKTLDSLGYTYIFADEFACSDTPSVMLTFDDGYTDNYTDMFPILKKYNAKATIFMVTSAIDCPGYLTSEQIKEMADSGLVRFASHTHNHRSLTSMSEADIRAEFEQSKQILAELTGYETNAICYPGGSVSDAITLIAEEYFYFGYTTVNSSYTFDCDPMLIPRIRVSRGMTGKSLAARLG